MLPSPKAYEIMSKVSGLQVVSFEPYSAFGGMTWQIDVSKAQFAMLKLKGLFDELLYITCLHSLRNTDCDKYIDTFVWSRNRPSILSHQDINGDRLLLTVGYE